MENLILLDKSFTLPPAVTAVTNLTSAQFLSSFCEVDKIK